MNLESCNRTRIHIYVPQLTAKKSKPCYRTIEEDEGVNKYRNSAIILESYPVGMTQQQGVAQRRRINFT